MQKPPALVGRGSSSARSLSFARDAEEHVGVAGGGVAAGKVKGAGKDAAGVDKGKGPELALGGRVVPTEENLATAKTEKHLPVHLFVAAVGDGEVRESTPAKTKEILDQVVRKSSKEQNTVVHVQGDGPLHIQLRVFAATSVEARALKEYIRANEDQTPCPFIMLVRQLPMAVQYDPTSLDPSISSVADRLRKQAKTRAIKLLREVIFDAESGVTAAMLRGREGPMVPARRLEALVMRRAVPLHSDGAVGLNAVTAFIVFPAVRRDVPAAAAADGHSGDEPGAEQIPALRPSAAANLAWTAGGATWGGVTRRIDVSDFVPRVHFVLPCEPHRRGDRGGQDRAVDAAEAAAAAEADDHQGTKGASLHGRAPIRRARLPQDAAVCRGLGGRQGGTGVRAGQRGAAAEPAGDSDPRAADCGELRRAATGRDGRQRRGLPAEAGHPPPPSRTKWTRLVHPSVLTGHVSARAGQDARGEARQGDGRRPRSRGDAPPSPPPPPPARTKWTRRVPHPVLIGHAVSNPR